MLSLQSSNLPAQASCVSIASRPVLRSTGILPRRSGPYQQTRSFRFGLWSSYLDANFEKECRRRHRVVKHKYIEALNRKLSWDRHLPGHPKAYGFKGFMCTAWNSQDSRPGGRWVNLDELRAPKKENVGKDSLPKSHHDSAIHSQRFWSIINETVGSKRNHLHHVTEDLNSGQHFTDSRSESSSHTSDEPIESTRYGYEGFRKRFQSQQMPKEPGYKIDPITNRKVYEVVAEPARADSNDQIDIPVKTFKGYRSQFQNFEPPTSNVERNNFDAVQESAFISQSSGPPVGDGLEAYDSKVDYTDGAFYDVSHCDIDYKEPTQASLKDHDDRLSRKVCQMDSDPVQTLDSLKAAETTGPDRDDVQRAIHHYEATVTRPKDLLRAIESYEARRPKPFRGLFKQNEKPHPLIQAIEEYERSKLDTQNSNTNQEKLDPLLKSISDYQKKINLEKMIIERSGGMIDKQLADVLKPIEEYRKIVYQARYRRESVNDGLEDYDSKVNYSGNQRNDIFRGAEADRTEDLDLLRASDIRSAAGILKKSGRETEEEKLAKRKELELDFKLSHERQVQYDQEMAVFNKVKLARNGQFDRNVDCSPKIILESRSGSTGKDTNTEPSRGTSKGNAGKLTGNFVRDFPEEFEASWQQHDSGTLMPKSNELDIQNLIRDTKVSSIVAGNPNAARIETSLDRTVQEPNWRGTSTSKDGASVKSAIQTEGNSSASVSSHDSPKETDSDITAQTNDEHRPFHYADASVNSALHTLRTEARMEDDLVREVCNIYEQGHGIIDPQHRQVSIRPAVKKDGSITFQDNFKEKLQQPEPTLYKILAYDPTMQSISTAETTSIVEDSSTPLTPAEVLLRLSNPAKFFPHFQPLQSQGYEIVSGSGDVLVFRRVRIGKPASRERLSAQQAHHAQRKRTTNPIDGMQGSPIATTGDFASPTGFVNYDLPRGSDPPFKSNIDVRREEPVFSGKSSWQEESKELPGRKKNRSKKVLVSAIWVAGCCYAVGVVAEFFKTGGIDGMGPQGF